MSTEARPSARFACISPRMVMAGLLAFLLWMPSARAIDLGGGSVSFDFSTTPLPGDLSTLTAGVFGNSYEVTDQAGLDASIQFLAASTIYAQLPFSATIPPSANAAFRRNVTANFLQSRPTNARAAVMLATLTNSSSNYIDSFDVSYDMTVNGLAAEEVPHHSIYFSTSGNANTWTRIADLGTTGPVTISQSSLGTSFGNDPVYLLWVDENALGTDFTFTMDNMTFSRTLGGPKLPDFGAFTPVQVQDFEGGGIPLHGAEPAIVVTRADGAEGAPNNSLRVNGTQISAVTELVDVRGLNGRPKVSLDVKAWQTDADTDFEENDQIAVTVEYSHDGINFLTEDVVRLDGAYPSFDALAPNPADQITAAFPDNSELGPYNHYELRLEPGVQTLRVRATLKTDSASEFLSIDNITIYMNPEPTSLAMLALGMIGLVGYRHRSRG